MKKYITLFAIIILFSGCSSIGNNFIGILALDLVENPIVV